MAAVPALSQAPTASQGPTAAQAKDPKRNLDAVQQEMQSRAKEETALDSKARDLRAEIDGIRERMIAAAAEAQDREDELSVLEEQVAVLNTQFDRKQAELLGQR